MPEVNANLTILPTSMSSREIAELTGKRHDHVVRDIEKMLHDLGEGLPKFGDTYTNEQNGQKYRCYNLPKNLTLALVSGYRADMRLKIIDRWLELESAPTFKVPTTMREALLLAADQQAQIEAQEKELAITTPKAAALDRIANTTGRTNLREVGKVLGIGSKQGIELLRSKGWIFRSQSGKWHAYAAKVDAGLVDVKYTTYTNTSGEEVSVQQVFVTPKGMVRLSEGLSLS